MPKGYWKELTIQDENFIKENYLKLPVKRLANQLNMSDTRIKRYLKKNGLTIPEELVQQRIAESRFQKGCIPATKGKKQTEYMSKAAIERTKATRFKKGQIPHNTKPIGTISKRSDKSRGFYLYIKVAYKKWELLHRVVYTTHFGPIPKDKIVAFKDGNVLNCNPDNLELITMEENVLRNSKYNFPKEVIPSMALVAIINKKVKQLENGKK